jgi:D-alanine-D-alanine ligase
VEAVRVGVLMGGVSSEREISLRSGEAVAAALEGRGHEVQRIDIRDGMETLDALADADIDVAFLALHGKQGEDGCIQGVLEMLGIPYTGSGVLTSALAMDKLKSKELFRLHNVPTPPYYLVSKSERPSLLERHASFGFPVVVKPRREGSSVGVSKVNDFSELGAAIDTALLYDDSVLVERYIAGSEIAVAVLDGRVLGAIEIEPAGEMYDFQAKYHSTETRYHLPARLEVTRLAGVLNLAERAAEALDVRGAARVDLLVTPGMNEYVLEVNTLPGMTATSLLPKIAAAAGYDFGALCEAILSGARLDSGLDLATVQRSLSLQPANVWEEAAALQDDFMTEEVGLPALSVRSGSRNQTARKTA